MLLNTSYIYLLVLTKNWLVTHMNYEIQYRKIAPVFAGSLKSHILENRELHRCNLIMPAPQCSAVPGFLAVV